ncbi:MAG TPA: hypothetical protein VKS21_11765, partial [Spirochaetota bacterium]|nr:hypothetical protein [Spirochaetota bacterium]
LKDIKSGRYVTYYKNGRKKKVMYYKNGFLHGRAAAYYPDGSLYWIIDYANGRKQGLQLVYYRSGRLYSKTSFRNGRVHGVLKKYRLDGRLEYKIPCREGKISGPVLHYNYYSSEKMPSAKAKSGYKSETKDILPAEQGTDHIWLSEEKTDLDDLAMPHPDSLLPEDAVQPPLSAKESAAAPPDKKMPRLNKEYKQDLEAEKRRRTATNLYPNKGLKEDEAWKYRMLEKGKDYEEEIQNGI